MSMLVESLLPGCGGTGDEPKPKPTPAVEEPVSSGQGMTDSSGNVVLTVDGEDVTVKVRTEWGTPLDNTSVHYLSGGSATTFVVVDPKGNYIPQRTVLEDTVRQSLTTETVEQPLLGTIALIMGAVTLGVKVYTELAKSSKRDVLERGTAVTKYCMTREQMSNDLIGVPAGILLLTATEAGVDIEELKIAAMTPLKEIFERYIVSKYGNHAGYEVHVPVVAVRVCEGKYDVAVCDPNDLRTIFDPNLPYWKIAGTCTPSTRQPPVREEPHKEPSPECTPLEALCRGNAVYQPDSCGGETLVEQCSATQYCEEARCVDNPVEEACDYTNRGDGTVSQHSTGLLWQQQAPEQTYTYDEAAEYCTQLTLGEKEGWRVPSFDELKSLCAPGSCRAQDVLRGYSTEDSRFMSSDSLGRRLFRYNPTILMNENVCEQASDGRQGYDHLLVRCVNED